MTTERELREKLRKISALFEGATSQGEREAAAGAIDRVRKALAAQERIEQPIEMNFTTLDRWHRRLFLALCRRYGLHPYRYPRQRYSTITLRAPVLLEWHALAGIPRDQGGARRVPQRGYREDHPRRSLRRLQRSRGESGLTRTFAPVPQSSQ